MKNNALSQIKVVPNNLSGDMLLKGNDFLVKAKNKSNQKTNSCHKFRINSSKSSRSPKGGQCTPKTFGSKYRKMKSLNQKPILRRSASMISNKNRAKTLKKSGFSSKKMFRSLKTQSSMPESSNIQRLISEVFSLIELTEEESNFPSSKGTMMIIPNNYGFNQESSMSTGSNYQSFTSSSKDTDDSDSISFRNQKFPILLDETFMDQRMRAQ